MTLLLREIETFLSRAERKIALIDRSRPKNLESEASRALAAWARGEPRNPAWAYAPPAELGEVREKLDIIGAALDVGDDLARLYAERARELGLEAELAESVGTTRFRELATRRYGHPLDASPSYARAKVWATLEPGLRRAKRFRSDDATRSESLLSLMQQGVRELGLPFGVVVRNDLTSAAAISEDAILIQADLELSEREARRIAIHELHGHALPRVRARREPLGLMRVGSARGADEEEGRALLMERRHGLFSIERQVELGRRHLAAWAVAEGADWVETVRSLTLLGTELDAAMSLASRVHRGGGLARERVYLPALLHLEDVFDDDPELEGWLERGRVSVAAARTLASLGSAPVPSPLALPVGSGLELHD